jgi:hypothetical protein
MFAFWMFIGVFISGFVLFLFGAEDIKRYLNINLVGNVFFVLFLIISLCVGLVVVQNIHYMQTIKQASNEVQDVSIHFCLLEQPLECSYLVNTLNNVEYNKLVGGEISKGYFKIPISVPNLVINNVLTYFIGGILCAWIFLCVKNVVIK